jgi:Fe-S-cluster containining protein
LNVNLLEPDIDSELPAGEFTEWLEAMSAALEDGSESSVPCGSCNACCKGAYFIHIRPEETATLAAIPQPLLFPAPGRPDGHRLLGFDENGHCPMLIGEACSVYRERPATCRTYDCRIFAATGIAEPGSEKAAIMSRARRWKFSYRDELSREKHAALVAGARYLASGASGFGVQLPVSVTQLAMLAVRAHAALLDCQRTTDGDFSSADGAAIGRLQRTIADLTDLEH